VERCIAYVEEAKVDLIWLNNVQEKGQIEEAAKRIPGAVMPTFGGAPPAPSLEELEAWGIAAAIFPAMTTSVGLQATWEFLNDFKERGQAAADERREQTRASKWGAVRFSAFSTPNADMVKEIEDKYLPEESQRDYENTFGHFAPPS
jgi:methylisocitrate lyase